MLENLDLQRVKVLGEMYKVDKYFIRNVIFIIEIVINLVIQSQNCSL